MFPAIDAAAAVVKKTAADMRSLYGDYINIDYDYEGQTYSTSATYYGTVRSYHYENIANDAIIANTSALSTYDVILYQASMPASNWQYVDVVVDGLYTRFDGYARGGFVGSVNGLGYNIPVTDAKNSVQYWSSNYADDILATMSDSSGYYGFASCLVTPNYSEYISLRMIQYEFQDGGAIDDIHFDGLLSDSRGHIFIGVICPYVEGEVTNTPAETTTITTGTDINVNVDVDLEETNGILSGIKQSIDNLVDAIINGLKSLFIPSDDFMDDFKTDMEELLQAHLGGLYEAEELIVDSFEELPDVVAKSEIYIPAVNLSLGGETLTLGDWHIPLKVSGLPAILYDGIAFIIDFLCIAAFLRMCRNKLEIFLNPDSEVIQQ